MAQRRTIMPGTKAALMEFFKSGVTAFNGHADMTPFLDENATVFSVNHHHAYSPQAVAAAYLELQYHDNPTFTIPNDSNVSVALNKTSTAAVIQGITTWTDDNHPGEPLTFRCTFVYNEDQATWLFSTMWAADKSDK
jgi:hypothetical protein